MQGKYQLELKWPGDGRLFLNFWDYIHGNDVVAEIVDGEIWIKNEDETDMVIDLQQFIGMVESSIKERTA